jgi:hypothetical protein
MRHGKLIDTEKLIGQKNREDEQGEAPERFTMRESPYTILEAVGGGLVSLAVGLFVLSYPKIENGAFVGWMATVIGVAFLLLACPLALYRVRVDTVSLQIGFGPITTGTILWSDVKSVKVIRIDGGRDGRFIKPHWEVKEMGLYGEHGCLFHGSHTTRGFTYLVAAAARLRLPAEEVEQFSLKDMFKAGF